MSTEIRKKLDELKENDTHYITSSRTVSMVNGAYFFDNQGLYVTVCMTASDMERYLGGDRDIPYAAGEYDLDLMDDSGEDEFFPWSLENGFKRLDWFDDVEIECMTTAERLSLITETVDVEDNPETNSFRGTVISTEENDVDGILITVMDQDSEAWDIEVKYVTKVRD